MFDDDAASSKHHPSHATHAQPERQATQHLPATVPEYRRELVRRVRRPDRIQSVALEARSDCLDQRLQSTHERSRTAERAEASSNTAARSQVNDAARALPFARSASARS